MLWLGFLIHKVDQLLKIIDGLDLMKYIFRCGRWKS
jgi:hypothetical protein